MGMDTGRRVEVLRRAVPLVLLVLVLVPVVRIAAAARLVPADLTFNNGTEVTTLDPAIVTGVPEGRVIRSIFEGLYVKHPRTLEPLPGIAESHELTADQLTYTFHLRDARWTNGDPVTAHDFVYAWERLLAPETAAEYAYQLWYVKGAREYSRLPSDRLYTNDLDAEWVKPVGNGRVRVGVTGALLAQADPAGVLTSPVRVGDVIEGTDFADRAPGEDRELIHDVAELLEFPNWHAHVPVDGRVTAVNANRPATVRELLEDPYEAGWLIELEVADGHLDELVARNELYDAAAYKRELFWPNRVGIRARDARTLVVELESPTPYFLQLTAFYSLSPVNPRNLEEAKLRWPATWQLEWLRPENLVTNGPFRVAERRINDRIRLVKSASYWDADSVALDSIDILAVENYATMLDMYLCGELAWIDRVSTNQVHRLIVRDDFDPVPYLGTYFYRVNVTRPPFDDRRVRTALALAIDRRAICEKIMKAGQIPSWSLLPPGMPGYAVNELEHAPLAADRSDYDAAFAQDLERAAALIAEAGFGPGAEPFPTFEVHYNTSEAHRDIAEVVAAGWKKHLGLDARPLNQEWKVYLDTQQALGYDVSRSAWIADYVDPNTFLDPFVTGGENNKTGWGNAQYDDLVQRAGRELDPAQRMRLLGAAEAILLRELPILPVFYYVTQSMFDPRIGGFYENMLDEHFPKHWYWKSDAELAAARANEPPGTVLAPAPGPSAGKYAKNHVNGRWD